MSPAGDTKTSGDCVARLEGRLSSFPRRRPFRPRRQPSDRRHPGPPRAGRPGAIGSRKVDHPPSRTSRPRPRRATDGYRCPPRARDRLPRCGHSGGIVESWPHPTRGPRRSSTAWTARGTAAGGRVGGRGRLDPSRGRARRHRAFRASEAGRPAPAGRDGGSPAPGRRRGRPGGIRRSPTDESGGAQSRGIRRRSRGSTRSRQRTAPFRGGCGASSRRSVRPGRQHVRGRSTRKPSTRAPAGAR